MTVWGHCRVSTDPQDNESQRLEIETYAKMKGIHIDSWIHDTISTRKSERQIYKLIGILKPGDVIISTEFTRLARGGMIELVDVVNKIRAAKADLIITRGDHNIKATGEMGITEQAILFAFGIASQIERDQIALRTRAGMAVIKANGYRNKNGEPARPGRPEGYRKLAGKKEEIVALLQTGVTKKRIAEKYEVSRVTLDNFIKGLNG